jgi:tetratricopeptide (TPR) repeat protein
MNHSAPPAAQVDALRYCVFLSYSHRDSKASARLHRRIESFRVPAALRHARKHMPARLGTVFRDREELGSAASLSQVIQAALDASAALVVLCSPAAAASRWVNEEIRYFRLQHPQRPVFAFVVAGDPGADPRQQTDTAAIPLQLLLEDPASLEGALAEPLAADARTEADGFDAASLKLIAGLLGVGYDQLRHREQRRRQQRWAMVSAGSLLLSLCFAMLAWQAMQARDAAREAQSLAELELASERQTRGFLLSVFQLADAGEARGNAVTVREVLDRAVQRIDETRFSRAEVRLAYLATLGRAYSSLGLNQRARELLQDSLQQSGVESQSAAVWSQRVESHIELADLLFDMGDYVAAQEQLEQIATESRRSGRVPSIEQQARTANVRGDVLSFLERDAEARLAYQSALDLLAASSLDATVGLPLKAHGLYGLAQLAMFDGRHDEAESRFAEAVELLVSVLGERHPRTITAVLTRGTNAFEAGLVAQARSHWTQALSAATLVYNPDSPQLGTLNNNLGRLELEAGRLELAEPLMRAALRSDRLHRSETFDDLAFPLANLGIVRFMQGDHEEAGKVLREALTIAEPQGHRALGVIRNHLADLECTDGLATAGLGLAELAIADAIRTHGADDWRVRQARITREYCVAMAGTEEGADLESAQRDVQALLARQNEDSPFGMRARQQLGIILQRHAPGSAPRRSGSSRQPVDEGRT